MTRKLDLEGIDMTPKDLPELPEPECASAYHAETLVYAAEEVLDIQREAYDLGARSTAAQPAAEQEPVVPVSVLSGMVEPLEGVDSGQPGYHWRRGWNDALRRAMDYARPPAASGDSTPPSEPADGEQLWLWQNGDHFLAFRNLYPCYSPGGDPMTLGEPFGRAIFKHSHNREGKPNEQQRTDRQSPRSGANPDIQRRRAAGASQACAAGAGASLGYGEHQAAPQVGWGACSDGAREQQISDIAGAAGVLAAGRNFAQGVAAQGDSIGALRPEPEAVGQDPLTLAARDVLAERRRQVEAEGWTPEHDDEHSTGELAAAAACYALAAAQPISENDYWRRNRAQAAQALWPWDREWWKPTYASPRRMLVKATALLLAEIERRDRASPPPSASQQADREAE